MNDLSGLSWSSTDPPSTNNPPPPSTYPTLRPTPSPNASGRSTPLSSQLPSRPQSKPSTPLPTTDSFSGLLASNRAKSTNNVSLQERQRQLLAEKSKQEEERRKKLAQEAQLWDSLGSGKSTPEPSALRSPIGAAPKALTPSIQHEDDILSAFAANAPVDSSSHLPAPRTTSSHPTPPIRPDAQTNRSSSGLVQRLPQSLDDPNTDDDPFGLVQMVPRTNPTAHSPEKNGADDGDDILGMLGKPVSELPPKHPPRPPVLQDPPSDEDEPSSTANKNPQDGAVAELVDMGFSAETAAWALGQTVTGKDIQGAVGILLTKAHDDAKQKSSVDQESGRSKHSGSTRERSTIGEEMEGGVPSWLRKSGARAGTDSRKHGGPSEANNKEKGVAQLASEIGTTLFKSANSLWRTGQKKVQRAVADLQQEQDSSQPKWMRDAQLRAAQPRPKQADASDAATKAETQDASQLTNEAMLLDSGNGHPQKPSRRPQPTSRGSDSESGSQMSLSEGNGRQRNQPRFLQDQSREATRSPLSRVSRQDTEEQSAQAYVSPARRKPPVPKPSESSQSQADLFDTDRPMSAASQPSATQLQSNNPFAAKPPPSQAAARPTSIRSSAPAAPPRPKVPPRRIPPISSSALVQSAGQRQKGTEAFKRGDYAASHAAYANALNPLPTGHPVTIVILCNRALTSIKTGDPKAAIVDADAALRVIGPSQGDGEKITIVDAVGKEEQKDMKDFFGKALMRKAEALENLERWAEAASIWRQAVEAGVGSSVAIQGRNRCEKAARPKPPPSAARPAAMTKRGAPVAKASSALASLSAESDQAVKKLREANAAAEQADNEKFALTDLVDARLAEWKGTKADNLRALLGSLDKVLWPEAGWKKVNMSDLVMANKVKIVYMKAIAKVHPDKVSQSSTTEQKMISAAVFSTLNEAWEKFKKDNNL